MGDATDIHDVVQRLAVLERQRRDWTGHPMVVMLAGVVAAALIGVLIGVLSWLAVGVMNLQTDVALLQKGQTEILARLPVPDK